MRFHDLGVNAELPEATLALRGHRLGVVGLEHVLVVDTAKWRLVASIPVENRLCWLKSTAVFCGKLDVYRVDGAKRFHVDSPQPYESEVVGMRAFLRYGLPTYGVLDLQSGRLTQQKGPIPELVPGQPGMQRATSPTN